MTPLLLLAAWAGAANLGGGQAGCPMTSAVESAERPKPAKDDPLLAQLDKNEGLIPVAVHQGWNIYASLGMSCDPYFLFYKDGEQFQIAGEDLGKDWSVRQQFNLYFPIRRTIAWKDGKPVETTPKVHPLSRKAKRRSDGLVVELLAYEPEQDRVQAKVKGKKVWLELAPDLFEGVTFHGD